MFFSELFLQTVNIIIIVKQPVFAQLNVYRSSKQFHFTPRGRQNKTFPFDNFQLVWIYNGNRPYLVNTSNIHTTLPPV